MRISTGFVLSISIAGLATAAAAAPGSKGQPAPPAVVHLSIESPDAGPGRGPLSLTRWPLVVRLEARKGIALIEASEVDSRREAVVLSDPDGCIDMRSFKIDPPALPYEDCNGPDETWFEFTSERFNSFDVPDERAGNPVLRAALVDDAYVPDTLLNVAYLLDDRGRIAQLPRPQTGGGLLDGYGYGADDDLPGLVIMADVGGARVFDPDFNLVPGVVRNLAGFVNNVSVELATLRGGPAVTASMHALAGVFEPVALFDLDVAQAGTDFLRRLESGPIESFEFLGEPLDDDALFRELMSTYSPYPIEIRVALVQGAAPAFIRDLDGDGAYTANDLRAMGYTLLSNQASARIVVAIDALITQTSSGRTCPPRSLIFSDLDGNGASGQVACMGSGGAARLRRVPR
jgi:hypothetical protein